MDDSALIQPEPLGHFGDLALVRWRDPVLPPGFGDLIAEASSDGIAWIADFPSDWSRRPFLADGEGLFLTFRDGTPIAMAVISADPHVPDTDVGRLRYIYIAMAERGRGLARILVEACLTRGEGRWGRLRLHTDNPLAARLYESYGFRSPVKNSQLVDIMFLSVVLQVSDLPVL